MQIYFHSRLCSYLSRVPILVEGTVLLVCGVRNWSLMVFVLFVKKVAKTSAVRVDERGGGGGQRREENVLKSARELEQLLILLW